MARCRVSQLGHSGVILHGVKLHDIVDVGYPAQSQTNFAISPFRTKRLLTFTDGRSGRIHK